MAAHNVQIGLTPSSPRKEDHPLGLSYLRLVSHRILARRSPCTLRSDSLDHTSNARQELAHGLGKHTQKAPKDNKAGSQDTGRFNAGVKKRSIPHEGEERVQIPAAVERKEERDTAARSIN